MSEEIGAETPESIMINFTHTIVSEGRVAVILKAQRAETYETRKEIQLQGVHYQEFDETGALVAEARSDRAIFYTEPEDAKVKTKSAQQ